MQLTVVVSSAVLLLCGIVFGQSVPAAPQPQTVRVGGTIKDPSGAAIPRAKVEFRSKQFDRTVTTNDLGVYAADLAIGDYTMTAQSFGFRPYRRPIFRTMPLSGLTFDITLPVQSTCDIEIVSTSTPVPPEGWATARKELCLREEFFPIPARDGVPFQLYIRYVKRSVVRDTYIYTCGKMPNEDPVFVAYNLFSLQADEVFYDAKNRTIKADGNVVSIDESGATQRANSMTYKLENGQATPLSQ